MLKFWSLTTHTIKSSNRSKISVITIDCREIESYKHELAVFVADWIGAIPTMKLHEFVLSPIDDEHLEAEKIVKGIKEFFASLGETANFAVLPKDEVILVKSLTDRTFVKEKQPESMFSCTHCGYVTQYEGLLQTHMKLHYL
jgi:hypothetical protein